MTQPVTGAPVEYVDDGEAMVEQPHYIAVATFLVWRLVSSLAHTPRP